jgi:putative hemolysin
MDDGDTLGMLVIGLCLLGSMFFSGGETAITAFGERQAARLKEEGGKDGRAITPWVDRPVWVLSTILLGNNVTNTLMGATATALAIKHLEGSTWGSYAVPVAVVLTTGILLVFGEIIPKAFGRIYKRTVALPVLAVLNVLGKVAYPLVWVLARLTEIVIHRATEDDEDRGTQVTSGELGYLVKVAEREGTIPAEQAALLQRVFRFENKIVRDIMVPIDRVTAVDKKWSLARIKSFAQATGHSRLPVYSDDLDHIVGVLHIKQIVGIEGESLESSGLQDYLRDPFFVSESLLIQDLLRRFKQQRVHLAIVVDDGGDTVGVVTLEDVLEQIVGHIFDESDRAPQHLSELGAGLHYFDGQDSLARVEETLGGELEDIDGVDSIGDLLSRLAGQIPVAGSIFVWDNIRFKVLSADAKRISRVSVERIEDEGEETG